jgi:SPP1 family predicted phage head-tail adaptor
MALDIKAGARDRRISFERATITKDAMNADVETWSHYADAWASVSYGTGQERRSAAQEAASLPATFRVRWSPVLAEITAGDRLTFMGAPWDITSVVPYGRNEGIDITAVRAA